MMYFYGNHPDMMWYGGGFGVLGAVLHLLFWLLVILLVIKLLRRRKGWNENWHRVLGEKSALDILKERYAKGEIDKAEFEEKKKDLSL